MDLTHEIMGELVLPPNASRSAVACVPVRSGCASGRWGKFGCAPGWSAGDDMLDHASTGGGVLARMITYARSRFSLG